MNSTIRLPHRNLVAEQKVLVHVCFFLVESILLF